MNAKTKIALTLSAGVVVVLGSRALLPAAEPSAAEPGSSQTELLAAEVPDVEEAEPLPFEASTPEEAANPQRVPLAPRESPEAESATVEPEPETEPSLLAGIVIDVDGQPIAGVPLHLGPYGVEPNPDDEPAAWTDRAGRFELATRASPRSRLRVAGESWATLIGSRAVPDTELVLVVAPRIDLEGKVVDEEDRPVADARVEVHLPEDLRSRLGRVLDESYNVRFAATTDAAGSFALDAVAWTAGAELLAARTGFQRAAQPLPRYPDARLRLVLARPPGGPGAIEGRVVDGEDLPIEGALVALGLDLTQTDSEGLFSLPLNDPEGATARFSRFAPIERDRLTAVSPGYAPGVLLPSVDGNGEPHWPGFVTLRLDLPSLSISGQVVDEAGSPLPEAVVWVADPTTLGGDDGGLILIEHYLGERNQSRWSPVPVDERGRFEIAGLADRKYTVQAWHEESLTFSVEARAHAGTEHLTVVVPLESERWARLEGRVVDLSGRPVEGVSVRLMADAFRMRHSGTTLSTTHVTGEPLLTTADGRFEWNDVAKGSLYVRVDGNDIEPIEYGRGVDGGLATLADESGDVARLEIPVFRRCHIQVLRPASLDVDGIGALDAEGNALTLSIWAGGSRRDGPRVPFRGEERSEVIAVPETARTILLVNEGEEVARLPVEPTPGEVVVLEP